MSQVVIIAVSASMIAMGGIQIIPVTGVLMAGAATARIMPATSVHLGNPARSDMAATLPNMPITMISKAAAMPMRLADCVATGQKARPRACAN